MYGKYTLIFKSPKNCTHAQTVCTRPLLGGRSLGMRLLTKVLSSNVQYVAASVQKKAY